MEGLLSIISCSLSVHAMEVNVHLLWLLYILLQFYGHLTVRALLQPFYHIYGH